VIRTSTAQAASSERLCHGRERSAVAKLCQLNKAQLTDSSEVRQLKQLYISVGLEGRLADSNPQQGTPFVSKGISVKTTMRTLLL